MRSSSNEMVVKMLIGRHKYQNQFDIFTAQCFGLYPSEMVNQAKWIILVLLTLIV